MTKGKNNMVDNKRIDETVSKAFENCYHKKAEEVCHTLQMFYKTNAKVLMFRHDQSITVGLNIYEKKAFMTGFLKTLRKRLKRIVNILNYDAEEENKDYCCLNSQFVAFEHKGKQIYGKVKSVITSNFAEELLQLKEDVWGVPPNKISSLPVFFSVFLQSSFNHDSRFYFYTNSNLMLRKAKVNVIALVGQAGTLTTSNELSLKASEVKIVGADEVLGAYALLIANV